MSEQQTCLEALQQYTGGDIDKVRIFAAGWIHAQAEKVALGACRGCMFRPSAEHRELVDELALDAAERYGLHFRYYVATGEFWLTSDARGLEIAMQQPLNSPLWHTLRGSLCGVSMLDIDIKFHERKGYGQTYTVTPAGVELKARD